MICHRLQLSSQTNRTAISPFHPMFYSFWKYIRKPK